MGFLDNQVALVTGGGRGLGRSIALALAARGASVAIDDVYRDEAGVSAADATVRAIEESGGTGLALSEDVTTVDGAAAMVEATVQKFGRLDMLVLCAGNTTRGRLHELDEAQWDSLMSLHLKGHFLACKMALPHMLAQNSGRIVTVGSRGAFFQVPANKQVPRDERQPPSAAYSAAKAGILGMTTTLAVELWETGITVNCLMPSASTQLFPDTKPRMVGGVPASNSLDPDDIAPTVEFLCGPDAADISGRIFFASGGDVILYGNQLDLAGSRMIRKDGRWTADELSQVLGPLAGL
ncbi:SDR family NAD(P)-dependent oxidoreductase [Rhodococcus koreensis]